MSVPATETPAPAETPTPGDPAPESTPPAPETPTPTPAPEPEGDPAGEDSRVTRANRQAAQYRTELRAAQEQLATQGETLNALAAVFNPGAAPESDPAAQLASITTEAENLRSELSQTRAELLVHTLAGDTGANPVSLLDSRTFVTALHGLDPAADDYHDQVAAAIKDAVSKNASLSTGAGQGPSRGGAQGAGQGPAQPAGAVTQEQFAAMGYSERTDLYRTNPDLYRRLANSQA